MIMPNMVNIIYTIVC